MDHKHRSLEELQVLEQNLQQVFMQKHAFQLELTETDAARSELEKTDGDVFKMIGSLLIKTDKISMQKELDQKKKMLELRVATLEKQELSLATAVDKLRQEIVGKTSK